ncbi:MAG TPA: DUF11 domain-containing protein, partial [Chloroflexi bacterium]|nr:DUF11 domain-containing protein [Chloroflexota bacterium]
MHRKYMSILAAFTLGGITLIGLAMLLGLVPVPAAQAMASSQAARTSLAASPGDVVINEFVAKGTEWIELYNTTAQTVSLIGWYLSDGEGTDHLTGTIPAHGYLVTNTANIDLDNSGDEIRLYDDGNVLIDQVAYGTHGGAPIPPTGVSAARPSDGVDTDDDARDWNLDPTPTAGSANDAPPVALGTSLILNEFDNYPTSGNDKVELYNPTTQTISLDGWMLSDGDALVTLSTTKSITPGGWVVLEENVDWTGMDFSWSDVGYLFQPDGTRVDQIGWAGEYEDNTFQRIPDGTGPNDGYDWDSSGAPCHWRDLSSTLGYSNNFPPDLAVAKTGPSLSAPGSFITYTIIYSNTANGGSNADQVVITDILPSGVAYITDTSGFLCPACVPGATGVLTWAVGSLSVCDSGTFTLLGYVSSTVSYGSLLTNTVEITSADGDVALSNNSDLWTTGISPLDLSVSKAGPDYGVAGEHLVYFITLENQGILTATNVVLTDTLPVSTTYVSDGSGITPTCASGVCVWSFGDVPSNTIHTFNLTVTVDSGVAAGTVLTNSVEVSTDTAGDPLFNNTDQWTTAVYPLVSIHDIQYVDDPATDDASPYEYSTVWVEGVVVAGTGEIGSSGSNFVIEDPAGGPWSGLRVYNGGTFPDVAEGDYVRLLGQVYEYYGMTELKIDAAPHALDVVSTTNPLPAPAVITTGAFINAATAEQWESVLIEFQGATVTDPNLGYGEWAFDDGTGATRADDYGEIDGDLTYTPALNDYYRFIRGIGWYSYGDYKLEPRYDADIDLDYPVVFVYHDLEDVVHSGETVYLAGDFNGWNPSALAMTPNAGYSVFTATYTFDVAGTHEYKYVVDSGGSQWDWLNTTNRTMTVTQSFQVVNDYRDVDVGWAILQWPPTLAVELGQSTNNVYGRVYIQNVTNPSGEGRGIVAQVGYGTDPDPANWTWFPMTYNTDDGNNDEFMGAMLPTAGGVYSYAVRFDGNWAPGNPNAGWT